jgi:urease accessory protein
MVAELNRLLSVTETPLNQPNHLEVQIGRDRLGKSFVRRQYATYPFRVSRALRLDPNDPDRTYLYMMNSSPGLLAGDALRVQAKLDQNTRLYLTDQSATKAHAMAAGQRAELHYVFEVGAGAMLEFLPEPLILYRDAHVHQTTQIILDPAGSLVLSEILVPGRLARGEFYQFHRYFNRIQVNTPDGELVFADAMHLSGQQNRFADSPLFATMPILANLMVILPDSNLPSLSAALADFPANAECSIATSRLPNCNGLLIRAMARSVPILKNYIQHTLTTVRTLSHQSTLPEIPK